MSAQEYLRRAATLTGLQEAQLRGRRMDDECIHARWAVMRALCRAGMSNTGIGKVVNRDRTTVLHGIRQADELLTLNSDFAALCAAVEGQ